MEVEMPVKQDEAVVFPSRTLAASVLRMAANAISGLWENEISSYHLGVAVAEVIFKNVRPGDATQDFLLGIIETLAKKPIDEGLRARLISLVNVAPRAHQHSTAPPPPSYDSTGE